MLPSPPPVPGDAALFLDLDGTLLEIAPSPDAVQVHPMLRGVLERLQPSLSGALALVSGRSIAELDRILSPMRLAAAGQHGLEWRAGDGTVCRSQVSVPAPAAVAALRSFADAHPGTLLEHKGASLALHYRGHPEAGRAAAALVSDLAAAGDGTWEVLHGKMVVELRPAGIHKGEGIRRLMERPPFAGRMPVFAGDDWTDEDGFRAVNDLGGVSVAVGLDRASAARCALPDVPAVHAWLAHSLDLIAAMETG